MVKSDIQIQLRDCGDYGGWMNVDNSFMAIDKEFWNKKLKNDKLFTLAFVLHELGHFAMNHNRKNCTRKQ